MATAPPRCRCSSICRRPAACSRERRSAGDVVVFRWPGDRAQAWVKRVVGLPGDRIQMRQGQLFVNDRPAELKPDGIGEAEDDNGNVERAYRYVETLPNGVSHLIFKMRDNGRLDNTPEVTVPRGQTVRARRQPRQFRRQPRVGARRRRRPACRSTTSSAAPTPWSAPGISACAASRSGPGSPASASRGFSRPCIDFVGVVMAGLAPGHPRSFVPQHCNDVACPRLPGPDERTH